MVKIKDLYLFPVVVVLLLTNDVHVQEQELIYKDTLFRDIDTLFRHKDAIIATWTRTGSAHALES